MSHETPTEQGGNGVQGPPPAGEPTATPPAPEASGPPGTIQTDIVMLGLAYFGIFALIPYLSAKENDFVRWHAKQCLTLTGVCVAGAIVLAIFGFVVSLLPVVGVLLTSLLWLGFWGGTFVLWLIAVIKAFSGERWKIPVIGDLAERW